jgi:hypothetical protein
MVRVPALIAALVFVVVAAATAQAQTPAPAGGSLCPLPDPVLPLSGNCGSEVSHDIDLRWDPLPARSRRRRRWTLTPDRGLTSSTST